ncbi:MAG: pyruvate kinase [Spirochaetes bacterium]|nr:pyruvate kinase [Spirochaetota bacterium]
MKEVVSFRKTKIVCTLGPSSDSVEVIRQLVLMGMNVARFNFSHGDHEEHKLRMEKVKTISSELKIPVGILLDTKGPEIRTGVVAGTLKLTPGQEITLTVDGAECTPGRISVSYKPLPKEVQPGDHIYIADGLIDLEVIDIQGEVVRTRVINGGILGSKKNVNVPGIRTSLPALGEQDGRDIQFGLKQGIDFIAASFIRKAQDVIQIRHLIDQLSENHSKPLVIAKIEDREGVDNIDEIIRVADGVMIARGDLGVQLPMESIPLIQKRIIEKCNRANKLVVTATQMLESMTTNPKPTRAELTDVANAVFDGTDAVMLSGETAGGKYPIEALRVMDRIIRTVEQSEEYRERKKRYFQFQSAKNDIPHATAKAAYIMAEEINASAIVGLTRSGNTARLLSFYRPDPPIIAVTPNSGVQNKLLLHWGVFPLVAAETKDADVMIANGIKAALEAKYVRLQEYIVVVAGVPIGTPLVTNMVRAYFLGTILCRGEQGYGKRVSGRVVKASTATEASAKLLLTGDEILVTREMNDSFLPFLPNLAGIVLETYSSHSWKKIQTLAPNLVAITNAPEALTVLMDNQIVTLSGEERIVYEGEL